MPHPKFLVAGALILGSICYLMFSGINDSTVYYYTVTELRAKPELEGRGLRLSGHVTQSKSCDQAVGAEVAHDGLSTPFHK